MRRTDLAHYPKNSQPRVRDFSSSEESPGAFRDGQRRPIVGAGAAKLYYGTSEVQVPKLVQVAELTAAQFVFGQRVAAQAEI